VLNWGPDRAEVEDAATTGGAGNGLSNSWVLEALGTSEVSALTDGLAYQT
jgi:hypothetical protein